MVLGVASVLGGFSISDSQRRQAERIFARIGGIDKLNVLPTDTVYDGAPIALQSANLGLRLEDATEGEELKSADGGQRRQRCSRRPAPACVRSSPTRSARSPASAPTTSR